MVFMKHSLRAGLVMNSSSRNSIVSPLPDRHPSIAGELEQQGMNLNLGGSVHDPTDPAGRQLFNALAMVAEFESYLIRAPNEGGHEGREDERPAPRQARQDSVGDRKPTSPRCTSQVSTQAVNVLN
jgi:hypothetical protein